mgnify:CR=1 FL=1
MALGRISIKVGTKGKALPHSKYILREDQYAPKNNKLEKLEHIGHGNMPAWAEHDPKIFWAMADLHERKNGSTYREHIITLPRELDESQRLDLVQDWISQEIGEKYAYAFAIHNPRAMDGKEQPHCHLMFSERLLDGIERDPDQFFKRFNSKDPSKGGAKKDNTGLMDSVRKTLIKEQRSRWEVLCNKHLAKAYEYMGEPPPEINMRNWLEKGLNQKPINLTMKELRDTNIRQSYIDRLATKRNYEQVLEEVESAKIDYYTAPPPAPPPKPKAPTPFDTPPRPATSTKPKEKEIIEEWRPKTTQPQTDTPPPPPIAPPLAGSQGVALPKAGSFVQQVTQQSTVEQLAKLRQLKRPTITVDSAIYVVDRTTREREKIALNSKDIINRLSELDKSDPNALLIIQTPNENVVKRIEKEIAKSGRDDRYIVIWGDENVNAQQAKLESEQRINAIKNVLNSDSSPSSTSDNDPAPAPAPKPSPRRYRP